MDQLGTSVWLGCYSSIQIVSYKTAAPIAEVVLGPTSGGASAVVTVGEHVLVSHGSSVSIFSHDRTVSSL